MQELEMYKVLLGIATYRAGGQIVATVEEVDQIMKEIDSLRIGVVNDNKILVRIVPK